MSQPQTFEEMLTSIETARHQTRHSIIATPGYTADTLGTMTDYHREALQRLLQSMEDEANGNGSGYNRTYNINSLTDMFLAHDYNEFQRITNRMGRASARRR